MKNVIKNRIPLSGEEKKTLWGKAVFIFDTNVLLDLYRSSEKYAVEWLKVLEDTPNIWLPKQVVLEFAENRWTIIYENADRYSKNGKIWQAVEKLILACKESVDSKEIEHMESYIKRWLEKQNQKDKRVTDPFNDGILDKLFSIFDGKVGEGFTDEELTEIIKEGKERYSNNIPPGYKDSGKDGNEYGDFIIWKEIITFSKEKEVDIIFVTRDKKEDWWAIKNGRTVGPREELREEFNKATSGHVIHFYSSDRFLEEYSKNKQETADKELINEAIKLSDNSSESDELEADIKSALKQLFLSYVNTHEDAYNYVIKDETELIDSIRRIRTLEDAKKQIEAKLNNMNPYLSNFNEDYDPEGKKSFEQKIEDTEYQLASTELMLKREQENYRRLLVNSLKKSFLKS